MDVSLLVYKLLALLFVVLLNAFFASAEVALLSVRPSRLREMAAEKLSGASAAIKLRDEPQMLLSVVQVGVTLASLGAGWVGESVVYDTLVKLFTPQLPPDFVPFLHGISFVISFLFLTFLMVVIGEVVPKNVAIQNADRLSLIVAPILLVFAKITRPFVLSLERAATLVSRLLNVRGEAAGTHSVEEIRVIVESTSHSGLLTEVPARMISRVLDFDDLVVREIMVPRNDIVSVPLDSSLDQLLRAFITHKYSRLPVYNQKPENIEGILLYKDLLRTWELSRLAQQVNHTEPPFSLKAILHKPPIAPETKSLGEMLRQFQQTRTHMALVVDEFGTIAGLVTVEDVIEQVTGEIEDEYDPEPLPMPQPEALIELDAGTNIRDLETQYGIELPVDDANFETLAGYLLWKLGDLPKPGTVIDDEGKRFTILTMERHRIARVRIETLRKEEQDPENAPENQPSSASL